MATTKGNARAANSRAARPSLPKVTVARFEETLNLIEHIAATERASFLQEMQAFRNEHRTVTRRPLSAEEATRFAAAMADAYADKETPDAVAARMQNGDLYAYDDPSPREVLVAAGMATAPAMVRAVRRFVALMELDSDTFEQAYEDDALAEALDVASKALGHVDLTEARARTSAAFDHWGAAAGVASGEVLRSLIDTVMGAMEQAAMRVANASSPALSQLSTDSPEPTAGDDAPSSTTPGTPTL